MQNAPTFEGPGRWLRVVVRWVLFCIALLGVFFFSIVVNELMGRQTPAVVEIFFGGCILFAIGLLIASSTIRKPKN